MKRAAYSLVILLLLALVDSLTCAAQQPVARAVLFWTQGCAACTRMKQEVLPALQAKYGSQLDINLIEVSETLNYDYFRQVEDLYKLPVERQGVPALFIVDRVLVGDDEIATVLPAEVDKLFSTGGADYPALPDLAAHLGGAPVVGDPAPPASVIPTQATASRGFEGFGLGVAVMAILILTLAYALAVTVLAMMGRAVPASPVWADVLVPVLAVVGMGVAGYLAFVETQNATAICGPVGDCNTVQSSPFARLFGVLPVGVLGLGGYLLILVAWGIGRFTDSLLSLYAPLALFGLALFGVLFSIYLTYLELAVILAVCAWCLTSALIMALMLVISVGPAAQTLSASE